MKKYNRAMQKIDNAYDEFKKDMMKLSSKDVYDFAYKIYSIEEIYEILINGYKFTSEMIRNVLMFKGNILLHIYGEWVDYETNMSDEFYMVIDSSIKGLNAKRYEYAA